MLTRLSILMIASAVALPVSAAEAEFHGLCLNTIGGPEKVRQLYCSCLARNIDANFSDPDQLKSAYIVIDPAMSSAEMKKYGKWYAALPPERQAVLMAAQKFVSGLIPICLNAAAAGKVTDDGSIVD